MAWQGEGSRLALLLLWALAVTRLPHLSPPPAARGGGLSDVCVTTKIRPGGCRPRSPWGHGPQAQATGRPASHRPPGPGLSCRGVVAASLVSARQEGGAGGRALEGAGVTRGHRFWPKPGRPFGQAVTDSPGSVPGEGVPSVAPSWVSVSATPSPRSKGLVGKLVFALCEKNSPGTPVGRGHRVPQRLLRKCSDWEAEGRGHQHP